MTPAQFKARLEAAGLNQTQAADLLEIARTTVVRWLNGSVPISRANARLISVVITPKQK